MMQFLVTVKIRNCRKQDYEYLPLQVTIGALTFKMPIKTHNKVMVLQE